MIPMRDRINKAYGIIYGVPTTINFVLKIKTVELKNIPETLVTRQADTLRKQRNLVAKNNEKSLF